ncbi:MAG: type II secretion system protein [Oscillospiraceae bacterium]|nr:type II secretion system protein [Oscillospiraceae bacterium]
MKRIFSNKSGFTLVEIVVAFAVFAIMAGMILSMVQLTVKARTDNDELSRRTERQSQMLTLNYKGNDDLYDSATETADGQFTLKFNSTCEVHMDYAVRGVETAEAGGLAVNEATGLNYFVGNTAYTNPGNGGGGGGGLGNSNGSALGQSQMSQIDTRITGNKNFAYITVKSVEHQRCSACTDLGAASCPHNGGACPACKTSGAKNCVHNVGYKYYITVSALGKSKTNSGTVPKEEVPFLQYRLRFYTDTAYTEKITESDGDYNYTFYKTALIDDYGYLNNGVEVERSASYGGYNPLNAGSGENKYVVSKTSDNSVTITAPCASGTPGYEFQDNDGYETNFWVTFKTTNGLETCPFPNLSISSFGSNGVATPATNDGDAKLFTNNAYKSYSPSIYGAYKYTKVKVS